VFDCARQKRSEERDRDGRNQEDSKKGSRRQKGAGS
jgi:hypothetical protein